MVPIVDLWAPILLAAVLVFVVSSVIHMFLGYHANDYEQVPNEEGVMDALRPFDIPPGDYVFPWAGSSSAMNSEEYQAKVAKGPVAFFTRVPAESVTNMGPSLAQWFVYCVLVGVFAAYLGGQVLAPGAPYMTVFQITGTTAFCAYALALPQRSIWFKQKWSTTLKSMFDGLVYALVTAGVFGWLWPS